MSLDRLPVLLALAGLGCVPRLASRGAPDSRVDPERVREATREFLRGGGDNSFFLWQWIGAGMMLRELEVPAEASR